MKKQVNNWNMKWKTALCTVSLAGGYMAHAQTGMRLETDSAGQQISRHIYGHFAEHLGRCIYDGFYVREGNTEIPNKNGIRLDIIEALKKLKVPNLRWPGGCFADTYHWKDGVGPKKDRPEIVNRWWGGVTEDNSFGTHDFLNMCELLGAEPYLAGNVGSGSPQELVDWVQYVNYATDCPMVRWRKQNGRENPWKVKYWGVGNEAWGCGGNMRPEFYADQYRKYATFMGDWKKDSVFRIASGANSADYNWTEVLMKNIPPKLLSGIALHHYAVIRWSDKGSATQFDEKMYFQTMQQAWMMDSLIIKHGAIMDKYDPEKKVALIVDEWGGWYAVEPGTNPGFLYQQNTMRDAMIAGVTLNIFNNHSDRVRMANLAQTVNVLQAVILTDKNRMLLTPTYHVMEMYNVHQDARLLPLKFSSPDYTYEKGSLPAVSASASIDANGKIHITLVNIDAHKEMKLDVDLHGTSPVKKMSGRVLQSGALQDYNSFDHPNKIKPAVFNGYKLQQKKLEVKLPPFSVVVLELN